MAESTKLRLVRCPKCENLLPELEDYSVYQCGGCGTVLRAKKKKREADALSEKSEEERVGEVYVKSHNSSEKGIEELSDASDTDKSNPGSLSCEQRGLEKKNEVGFVDGCTNQSKSSSEKWVVENGLDVKEVGRDEIANETKREDRDLSSKIGYIGGSQRSGRMSDWPSVEKGGVEGFPRNARADAGGVRVSTLNYSDEGPSNYHSDSSYGCTEPLRNGIGLDGVNRVQYPEQDRAELLRKLDELKEQLTRSCDVVDKPKEKVPLDGRIAPPGPYVGSDSWLPHGSLGSDRASMPFFGPDKHVAGPSYFNHCPDLFPYKTGNEMPIHGLHPATHYSNHVPPYGDPFGSQVLRRAPTQLPSQYQQPSHRYFSGQYIDPNHDLFESYQQSTMFHQPSCSCYYCYNKHHRVSAPVQSSAFNYRTNNAMLYHHENPRAFGPQVHNRGAAVPPLNSHGPQAHTRWPSDINSEMGGFVRCCPRRVVLTSSGRHCCPIAGGAPFIVCNNCFELLQLPKRSKLMTKDQKKLQCGTCSTVIDFDMINKKLILSAQAKTEGISTEVNDGSNGATKDYTSRSLGRLDRVNANFSSDDYDNSGYDFQAMDREPAPSPDQFLDSGKPLESHSLHSSSPSISEDEHSPEVLIAPREFAHSAQRPTKATQSTPPPGSPLQEQFDCSSTNHVINRFGKGNRSSRSDQEKVIPNKVTTRQNSLKEASLATEMEVSLNDYSNAGMSQDSGDATREDDLPKNHKTSESFFANIKKSFKDLSRSNQAQERGKSNVSVNGQFIPDRLVKKAEKLAGPIHPGQYWYDFQAGFWGVMGGPCVGIIPPLIEELNYPMPENCAGGDTGVFVNGRELHQKDLDLLASRGLPTAQDRSYIIEISGRVFDEDTGEELDSLGKLAPTVEKAKHGFGMKVPRVSA